MNKTKSFNGFPQGKLKQVQIPVIFFRELLPNIDNLPELKLTIYIFYRMSRIEGKFRYLRLRDIQKDANFMQGLDKDNLKATKKLKKAIELAIKRGTLLFIELPIKGKKQQFLFVNTPKGRAAIDAIKKGKWNPTDLQEQPIELVSETSNIFNLYEENIGALTPLIVDALIELENSYTYNWIEDAFRIAVENNKRSLRYIEAILDRWQREGRDDKKDRQNTEKDRRKYIEGEYSEFIDH